MHALGGVTQPGRDLGGQINWGHTNNTVGANATWYADTQGVLAPDLVMQGFMWTTARQYGGPQPSSALRKVPEDVVMTCARLSLLRTVCSGCQQQVPETNTTIPVSRALEHPAMCWLRMTPVSIMILTRQAAMPPQPPEEWSLRLQAAQAAVHTQHLPRHK